MDFRALDPNPERSVKCRCGNAEGAWIDPATGTMKLKALDRTMARIIGIHNGFIQASFTENMTNGICRAIQTNLAAEAEGSLFHAEKRNSMLLILEVGDSDDTEWWVD